MRGASVLVVHVRLGGPTDGPVTEEDGGRAVRPGPAAAISSRTTWRIVKSSASTVTSGCRVCSVVVLVPVDGPERESVGSVVEARGGGP